VSTLTTTRDLSMATNYGTSLIKSGLVWHIDAANIKSYPGTGSTWNDLSKSSQPVTLANSPAFSSNNKGYILFNGTNQYGTVSPNTVPSGTGLSFCVWNFGIAAQESTLIQFNTSTNVKSLNIHLPWEDGTVYFDAGDGSESTYDRIQKAAGTEYLGWNYWCFTKNSTTETMNIYRNGILWHTGGGLSRPIGTSTGIGYICSTNGSSDFHSGRIGMMSLYDREITGEEVLFNFEAFRGRYGV
jgi:hypothetical protein